MELQTGNVSIPNPTLIIKGEENMIVPEVKEISEEDFKRFIPTGIRVEISIPLAKNSNGAILGCNIDGFLPMWNYADDDYRNLIRSTFPVQPTPNALNYVNVYWDQVDIPIQTFYRCHRAFSGNVNIGLRVSSNTTQTGNIAISQLTAGTRKYFYGNEPWTGLNFWNSSTAGLAYAQSSFTLADMSLIRNISITPKRRNNMPFQDQAQKLDYIYRQKLPVDSVTYITKENMFVNQHAEDWLLFTPLSTFPAAQGGIISIEFFFDYTMVQFHAPLLPYPALANKANNRDIMRVTDSLKLPANQMTKGNFLFAPYDTRAVLEDESDDDNIE